MFKQTRTKDLALFVKLGASWSSPKTRADIPTYVLIPAFIISELKTAFQIGFLIFLPFLVIDLVVSSTLMSMGMMMLPPVFISLPFKILLFVLVDGWNLVTAVARAELPLHGHQDVVISLAMQAMQLAFKVALPLLLVGLVVGLLVSRLPGRHADPGADALVHPEDHRDSPSVLVVGGPWMLGQLARPTRRICTTSIPGLVGLIDDAQQLLAQFGEQHVTAFFLVLARIGPLFVLAPLFSRKMIPMRARGVAAVALAVGLSPVALQRRQVPTDALRSPA